MKELISVIVPVYKVEKFLNKCVESIVNQTYKNLEIILVDDGSPDQCPALCDEWTQKDERIKVVHKQNGGLSDARNAGLEIATGNYIVFVDSDDLIRQEYVCSLYECLIGSGADLSVCGYQMFWEDAEIAEPVLNDDDFVIYDTKEALEQVMSSVGIHSVVWNKLYKRDLLVGESFEKGRYHEDEYFTYKIVGKSKAIAYVKKPLYLYRQRNNSIMSTITLKHMVDKLDAYVERLSWLKQNFPSLYVKEKADICIRFTMCYRSVLQRNIDNKKEILRHIKNMRKSISFKYEELRKYSRYNQVYILGTAIYMDLFCKILEKRVPMK